MKASIIELTDSDLNLISGGGGFLHDIGYWFGNLYGAGLAYESKQSIWWCNGYPSYR